MTFNDIFKSSFLENVTAVSLLDMVLALALAFGLGMFIFLVYKKTYQGVMYSSSFGVTLVALTMITTLVILAVTSNVVLSLGMVGALSIVRFRTAIKEPLDIAFLFWAIAVGIVLAAGFIPLAVFGSVIIGVMLLVFVNHKSHQNPYMLVLQCADTQAEQAALSYLTAETKRCVIKSKAAQAGDIELNVEVRLKSEDTSICKRACRDARRIERGARQLQRRLHGLKTMAAHKKIDRICCAVLILSLILTILFMNGEALGLQASAAALGYETRLFDTTRVHTIDIVMDDWDSVHRGLRGRGI